MAKKKPAHRPVKPRLAKEGIPVETIDSRISKLSIGELRDKLDELDKQRSVLLEAIETKKAERASELLAELKSLGISPSVAQPKPRAGDKAKRTRDPNALCPICQIPGHDKRAHRSQGDNKKPFTPEELQAKGLSVTA